MNRLTGLILVAVASLTVPPGFAQQDRPRDSAQAVTSALNRGFRYATGAGGHVALGDLATLGVPPGMVFMPKSASDELLAAAGRPVPSDYVGMIIRESAMDWFALLQLVDRGHVDVQDIRSWTANDVMASVRDAVEQENVQRLRRGETPREVRRWIRPPIYDADRHRLSWCLLIVPAGARRDANGEVVYNAVTFGRTGYVRLSMTTVPDVVDRESAVPDTILDHIEFQAGQGFADFRADADRLDQAGLAGVLGTERLRKADLKTRLHAFGAPLVMPGAVALMTALMGTLVVVLYRSRFARRRVRRRR